MSTHRLPNVEDLKAKNDIDGLIKALNYGEDKIIRRDAAIALGDIGDGRAVDALIAALEDRVISGRRYHVARALGKIGGARAVEPLMVALKDSDSYVRGAAADSLGIIGDPRAVDALIATARDDEERMPRGYAAISLGKIGDTRAVEQLITFLRMPNYSSHEDVTEGLVEFGAPAVEPLIAALDGQLGMGAREQAERALEQIGDPRGKEWKNEKGKQDNQTDDASLGSGVILEFVTLYTWKRWKKGHGPGGDVFKTALSHWNAKRYDEALKRYKEAIHLGLTSLYEAAARSNMGQILLKQENVEAAITQFHKGLNLSPLTASTAYNCSTYLALIYEVLGKKDEMQEAIEISKEALKRNDTIMTAEGALKVQAIVRRVHKRK